MKRWRCDYARKGTTAQGRQKMLLYERGVCAVGVIVDLRGRVSFPVFAARNEKRGSLGRKAGRGLLLPFPCHVAYGWRGWSSCSSAGILVLEALLFLFLPKKRTVQPGHYSVLSAAAMVEDKASTPHHKQPAKYLPAGVRAA